MPKLVMGVWLHVGCPPPFKDLHHLWSGSLQWENHGMVPELDSQSSFDHGAHPKDVEAGGPPRKEEEIWYVVVMVLQLVLS